MPKVESIAHWATVIGTVVSAVALWWAARTFKVTADTQAEILAIELFQEYLTTSVEHPEFVTGADSLAHSPEYLIFAAKAFFTAESVLNLAAPDAAWEATIDEIICDHRPYSQSEWYNAAQYDPQFTQRIRDADC